jgi:hypothetical protein
MPNLLTNNRNRFDGAKKYPKTMFVLSPGLQSAVVNETQDYANCAMKNFATRF